MSCRGSRPNVRLGLGSVTSSTLLFGLSSLQGLPKCQMAIFFFFPVFVLLYLCCWVRLMLQLMHPYYLY